MDSSSSCGQDGPGAPPHALGGGNSPDSLLCTWLRWPGPATSCFAHGRGGLTKPSPTACGRGGLELIFWSKMW